MSQYIVAEFTFGSFRGFPSDLMSLEEARAFVADPPSIHRPRPQDELRIFEMVPVDDEDGAR